MKDQFKRILGLVRRTGDTMIVTDPNGEDVYVIMDLDQYESIIDGLGQDYSDLDDFESEGPEEVGFQEIAKDQAEWDPTEEFFIEDPEGGLSDEESAETVSEQSEAPASNDLDIWGAMKAADKEGQTWDISKLSQEELADLERQYQEFASRNVHDAITETVSEPNVSEEIPTEVPEDEDFGEEQFYLEPIE